MIENYHTAFLHEFAAEIMKRAQEGWKLDMSPAFMPKRHGSAFTCRFVKEESEMKEAVQETLDGLKDAGVYDLLDNPPPPNDKLREILELDSKPSWSTFGQELIESCEQMNEIIAGERDPSRVFEISLDKSIAVSDKGRELFIERYAIQGVDENVFKTKQELDEMEFLSLQEYGRLLGVKDRSRSQLIKKILKTQEEKTDG